MENVQRASDEGMYSCTARNKHNYTSHKSVEVKVLGKSVGQVAWKNLDINRHLLRYDKKILIYN